MGQFKYSISLLRIPWRKHTTYVFRVGYTNDEITLGWHGKGHIRWAWIALDK